MTSLLRHIRACNTAVLPGGRLPWRIGGAIVGWLKPELARSLAASTLVHSAYNAMLFTLMFAQTDGFRHLDKM